MGEDLSLASVCLEHFSPRSLHLEMGWACPACVSEQMSRLREASEEVGNGEISDGTGRGRPDAASAGG